MKNSRGITLIALIITIIVMIILVGVTINVAVNSGLFGKSSEAAKEAEKQSNCITYSKQTSNHKFICLIFMEYLLARKVVGVWN